MGVVMCQNISGGTEKGAEKVGRGSGFHLYTFVKFISLIKLSQTINLKILKKA